MRRSFEERQAEVNELGRYVDRLVQVEREKDWAYIDKCESRRLWDPAFKRRYDFHHPGGAAQCTCQAHRIWRGEDE